MQTFEPGDDLIFQLESGYGLLRVLAVDHNSDGSNVWHLLAYDEFFPDVESAELALTNAAPLPTRIAHMALTDRAFERTPASKLANRPVTAGEVIALEDWRNDAGREVSDRSALLMLGLR